jgi:hypothetical protein
MWKEMGELKAEGWFSTCPASESNYRGEKSRVRRPFLSGLGIVTPKERISIMFWAYESFGFERQKVRGGRSVCVVR